jgi:hypothetical protein
MVVEVEEVVDKAEEGVLLVAFFPHFPHAVVVDFVEQEHWLEGTQEAEFLFQGLEVVFLLFPQVLFELNSSRMLFLV